MGAVLALDLGTTLGWAVSTPDEQAVFASGVHSFAPSRYDGGGIRFLRFLRFLRELYDLSGPFSRIVYEEVRRHAGTDAAHVYGGFLAHLTAWAEEREIPYSGTPVATIKKHITGRGNASKQEVIASVRSLGYSPKDDNEADAIAILLHCLSTQAA